jgi:alpha-beta hydrolase superfamily lysophospholipase
MLTIALALVAVAIAGFSGLLALLYFQQERLIFQASTLPSDHRFQFDQAFEEIGIDVPGAKLNALHIRQPNPSGLVFFLHGNAGDLSTWTTGVDYYRRINYDLFIFDYRGYGKSTGQIESEAQLHADVRAAWDRVAPSYAGKPIVIYGRSLGTGLATHLAREVDAALLVLVTPFTSLAAAAKRIYPFAPEWLLKYPLRSDRVAPEVRMPVLLVHGTRDELLPLDFSRALLGRFRAPAELLVIDGATHGDIHLFDAYREGIAARVAQIVPAPVTVPAAVPAR